MSDLPDSKIYVADLAAYNAGHLRGEWLRLSNYENAEHLQHAIGCLIDQWDDNLLSGMTGPVEEFRIDDYEGIPSCLIPRHGGLDARKIMIYAKMAEAVGRGVAYAFFDAEYHRGKEPEEWPQVLEDLYLGTYASLEEWAWRSLKETGLFDQIPDCLRRYIDVRSYARDARLGGDICRVEIRPGKIVVFIGH